MQLIELPLSEIRPYQNNPRDNSEAVKYVAESIRKFGYRNYIHVDKNHVIICGHTRYLALCELKWTTVTVAVDDDMTPEQVRAYRLADNKVAEFAKWKPDLLDLELSELANFDFDMAGFGFELPEPVIDTPETEEDLNSYYGDERERTYDAYNLDGFDPDCAVGDYDIPMLRAEHHIPKRLINFNEVLTSKDSGAGVHFFIDDYRFERVWNQPERYIGILKAFDSVFTPDFSLYLDMPRAMQIWNTYRSRLIGVMCQRKGMKVIPTVSWADERSFDFCFDGIPTGGVVAISTVGIMRDETAKQVFDAGVHAMLEAVEPECVIMYGAKISLPDSSVKVVRFENENQKRLSQIGDK